METGDPRYLHLNTGMWIGSGVRRGTEGTLVNVLYKSCDVLMRPVSRLRRLPRLLDIASELLRANHLLGNGCSGALTG